MSDTGSAHWASSNLKKNGSWIFDDFQLWYSVILLYLSCMLSLGYVKYNRENKGEDRAVVLMWKGT